MQTLHLFFYQSIGILNKIADGTNLTLKFGYAINA